MTEMWRRRILTCNISLKSIRARAHAQTRTMFFYPYVSGNRSLIQLPSSDQNTRHVTAVGTSRYRSGSLLQKYRKTLHASRTDPPLRHSACGHALLPFSTTSLTAPCWIQPNIALKTSSLRVKEGNHGNYININLKRFRIIKNTVKPSFKNQNRL